jgi:hypothetical protein
MPQRLAYRSDEVMTMSKGTEIFDAGLEVLEKVVRDMSGPAAGEQSITDYVDDLIREDVARFARFLRAAGWSSRDDSQYYDRFTQEIEGWPDARYNEHLKNRIDDLVKELKQAGVDRPWDDPRFEVLMQKRKAVEAKMACD